MPSCARAITTAFASLLLLIAIASAWTPLAMSAEESGSTRAALADAAHRILEDSCLRCHDAVRQKSHLRLDTRAGALLGGERGPAIVPGDPAHGVLMHAVRYGDPELQMPPKVRLTQAQIDTLAEWIAIDAPYPGEAGSGQDASATSPAVTPAPAPTARPPLVGRVHPLVVHFPIAFLLLAVLAEFLVVTRGPTWEPSVRLLLSCGVLGAMVAVATGTWFAPDGTLFHHRDMAVTRHEAMAWLTLVLACGTWALLVSRPRGRGLFRIALLATAGAVGLTGHLGGTMVYPGLF